MSEHVKKFIDDLSNGKLGVLGGSGFYSIENLKNVIHNILLRRYK